MTKTQERLFNVLSDPNVKVTRTLPVYVPIGDNGLTQDTGKIRVEFNRDPYTLDIDRSEFNEIVPEINVMRAL